MRKPAILITGANGEIGKDLIKALHQGNGDVNIITLDLNKLNSSLSKYISEQITGDILDSDLIDKLNIKYKFASIYHLAALLSTQSEISPQSAHNVNVGGTMNMLKLALEQGKSQENPIKFFFPSSIAVYGLKNKSEKHSVGAISENSYLNPVTMYGCNKLYCEHLGTYYSYHYQKFENVKKNFNIDFRSIRFPGIISSKTIPTGGGTSDYIPEMFHAASKGLKYKCFVRGDSKIPFMTMPDAIRAIKYIMEAPKKKLNKTVYNIRAFAPTAEEFRQKIIYIFPTAQIEYEINKKRQKMVDSWPSDTNDNAAQLDWDWKPQHDLETGLMEYLVS